MQIINPTTFYDKLITTGNQALYSYNNTLDDNGELYNILNLKIFNKTGEWLENQMRVLEEEGDDEYVTYGNLSYLSTVLDDTSYIVPQYTELFKLEVLGFEKDRETIISLFDEYAAGLNNFTYTDDDDNEIFITLGEHATPTYGEKQDIGGAERFIISLSILVRVTSGVITSKKIEISILNTDVPLENPYEPVKYVTFNMRRESDVVVDNAAGYEKEYDVQKTDFTLIIGALYLNDYLSKKAMEYLLSPESMDNKITIKYKDTVINKEVIFKLYITGVNPNIQFGIPISYTVSFKKICE